MVLTCREVLVYAYMSHVSFMFHVLLLDDFLVCAYMSHVSFMFHVLLLDDLTIVLTCREVLVCAQVWYIMYVPMRDMTHVHDHQICIHQNFSTRQHHRQVI